MFADALLVTLLFLFAYPFVVYPFILRLLASLVPAKPIVAPQGAPPTVALVVCALNEEQIIGEKIRNSLALNYPEQLLRLVFVSDGSTDGTARVIRSHQSQRLKLIDQPNRRGKICNLNEVVPVLDADIVVLSDANVMYDPDAILFLVGRFQDSAVGCVSGKVVIRDSNPALEEVTGDYYSLEWTLQQRASELFSMVGADGAMYAFRRELFRPCPPDTIIEDFVIPMNILRSGRRIVFESHALGWEQGAASLGEEFRRKTRIAAGTVQGLLRGNVFPSGSNWKSWFVFVSHKLLRWVAPVIGILALAIAALTSGSPLSRVVLIGFGVLSLAALLRWPVRQSHRALDSAFYFLFGQLAMAIGIVRGLAGKQPVLWSKANR